MRVDEENKEVSVLACPEKQAPTDLMRSEKTGKTLVHFDASVCKECKVNTRCPVKIGVGVATLTIDEASYAGAARHHQYMENTDYRKRCAIRAGAEATVSEMVRARGVRRSKHRTEGRTRLQIHFCCYCLQCKKIHQAWGSARVRCVRYCGNAPFRRCFCCTNGLSLIFSSCFITHLCLWSEIASF